MVCRIRIRLRWIGGCSAHRGYLVIRHSGRNVVARHDLLHFARVLCDVVLIVLAGRIDPLGIVLIELALIGRGQHSVPTLSLPIRSWSLSVRARWRANRNACEQSSEDE